MKSLIVGLGNPGTEYQKTRHNVGWIVIDNLYSNLDFFYDSYAQANIAKDGDRVIAKPTTFMNLSGETIRYFVEKKEYIPENIIVMYDDLDLPLGTFKISFDRGSGGHNGIKSIESSLGSRNFVRIRIGISKILETGELVKPNVLGNFEAQELEVIKDMSSVVRDAINTIVLKGKDIAMTNYNK